MLMHPIPHHLSARLKRLNRLREADALCRYHSAIEGGSTRLVCPPCADQASEPIGRYLAEPFEHCARCGRALEPTR